jgi:mono/diheme cytochrome c family protein
MYKGQKEQFDASSLAEMEKRKNRSYIKTPDEIADNLHRGDELSGSILYDTYCAICHQRNGKGDNNRYPPLAGSPFVTGEEGKLIDIVLNGLQGEIKVNGRTYNGIMPQNRHLDDHAIASIITYIRMNFGNNAPEVGSHAVKRIRESSKNTGN